MMILTNKLDTVNAINEAMLREALQKEVNRINHNTDTHMYVYNPNPNQFVIYADEVFKYQLDTTDYTAELTEETDYNTRMVAIVPDYKTLLVAIVDDSETFEESLASEVIRAVYQTL